MSNIHAPIQIYSLLKSCVIVFLIQALVALLAPVIIDQTLRLSILFINVPIAVVFGWALYKRVYHMVFTYDSKSFTFRKGRKEEANHAWTEFSRVSLFRTEYGDLSVRLYHNEDFFDLPASKLKLNPFDFRHEVMRLVSGGGTNK